MLFLLKIQTTKKIKKFQKTKKNFISVFIVKRKKEKTENSIKFVSKRLKLPCKAFNSSSVGFFSTKKKKPRRKSEFFFFKKRINFLIIKKLIHLPNERSAKGTSFQGNLLESLLKILKQSCKSSSVAYHLTNRIER